MRRCPSVSLLFPYTTLFRSPSSHAFRLSWRGSLHIRGPLTIRLAIKPDGSGIATIKIWKLVRVGFRSGSPEYKYCLERSEEHTSELQSRFDLVCRLLLEKTK